MNDSKIKYYINLKKHKYKSVKINKTLKNIIKNYKK